LADEAAAVAMAGGADSVTRIAVRARAVVRTMTDLTSWS